MLKDEGVIF